MAAQPTPTVEELDERDAYALVQAAEQAVKAIESLRSRMVGRRDATAATGHTLAAIVAAGGALREYDRRHVWALRHAIGGESFTFAATHDAASQVLASVVQALRPARDQDDATRQKNAQADMLAMSKILAACEHSIEATKNVEQFEAGVATAKATADRAAQDARLARGAPAAVSVMKLDGPLPAPARRAGKGGPKSPQGAPDGDFVIDGSADAPGGNPFPTTPVG